jgi:adenosylmethionine-8-amino-7-oxononanoate aminotransferase
LEALRIYEEMELPEHVERLSSYLASKLETINALDAVGDVRITGLMAGIELIDTTELGKNFSKKVAEEAEARGVLFRVVENVLAISPPLNVLKTELDLIVDVLRDSILCCQKGAFADRGAIQN